VFAADFMAAAPDEWKRTVSRVGAPLLSVAGLFRTDFEDVRFGGGMPLADPAPRFSVPAADAASFALAVGDQLLIDGNEYAVTDMSPTDDAGFVTATLRSYG